MPSCIADAISSADDNSGHDSSAESHNDVTISSASSASGCDDNIVTYGPEWPNVHHRMGLIPRSRNPSKNPQSEPAVVKNQEIIAMMKSLNNPKIPWCDMYERLISGMHASCSASPELMAARGAAMKALHKINATSDFDVDDETLDFEAYRAGKMELLRSLLGKVGEGGGIDTPFYCQLGCNIIIGEGSHINHDATIHDLAPIKIGSGTAIGPGVSLITEGHGTDVAARRQRLMFAWPIEIGDDTWLGANVTVIGGVKIGKGCTIGSCSLVNKDIPDFSIAVGSPCKVIAKVADPDAPQVFDREGLLLDAIAALEKKKGDGAEKEVVAETVKEDVAETAESQRRETWWEKIVAFAEYFVGG